MKSISVKIPIIVARREHTRSLPRKKAFPFTVMAVVAAAAEVSVEKASTAAAAERLIVRILKELVISIEWVFIGAKTNSEY